MSFTNNGVSPWANTFRTDALLKGGSEQSYFLKVGPLPFIGAGGNSIIKSLLQMADLCLLSLIRSLKGGYGSTLAISLLVPDFVPKPIGWGTYSFVPDTYFYICEFRNLLVDNFSGAAKFGDKLAMRHKIPPASQQSGEKFGFHVTTCMAR